MKTTVAERSASSAQTGDQLGARDRVEPGGWFVEEEDVRIGEQLDRDAGPLALPAAQCADPDVRVRAQSDRVDRVSDRGVDLAAVVDDGSRSRAA